MNKKRLLKLADLLEADADNKQGMRFDLNIVADPFKTDYDDFGYRVPKDPNYKTALTCGTVGCAMGLAAVSGAFKRSGLTYEIDGADISISLDGYVVDYESAAMRFFGIGFDEAIWLFSPGCYTNKNGEYVSVKGAKGERRVVKRIRKLVDGEADVYDYTV